MSKGSPIKIARRYARALYECLPTKEWQEEKNLEVLIRWEVLAIKGGTLFFSKKPEEKNLLNELLEWSVSPSLRKEFSNFIALLNQANRIELLGEIAKSLKEIDLENKGILVVNIESATAEVDNEIILEIKRVFLKTGDYKEIIIGEIKHNESLQAGLIAFSQGKILDLSLARVLNKLKL